MKEIKQSVRTEFLHCSSYSVSHICSWAACATFVRKYNDSVIYPAPLSYFW